MHIDKSKLIIGLKTHLCNLDRLENFASAEDKAWHQLTKAGYPELPGLLKVIRRLNYLNAVVVQVDPDEFDNFRSVATSYDPIEYCDINYALKLADFTDSVPSSFVSGTSAGRIIRKFHLSYTADNRSLGVGTRIALVDSGISPHPYLPSLSASELMAKVKTMHWSVPSKERDQICKSLKTAEKIAKGASIGTAVRQLPLAAVGHNTPLGSDDLPDIYSEATSVMERYAEKQWTEWEVATTAWISGGRCEPRPPIPCYPKLCGQIRLISPLSRSFLEGELSFGVNDVNGHGTQMASLIAALPPSIDCTNYQFPPDIRADSADPLQLDIVGIAPYAELMILKCCHGIDPSDPDRKLLLNGWMLNLLDALSYTLKHGADVIYCAFAIHDCDPRTVNSANRYLRKLASDGCIVVAPVGNETQWGSIAFPSSSEHVRAIAAVTIDPTTNSLSKADYSPEANSRPSYQEEIAFAGFGGDQYNSVLTTSLNFGFQPVWGTSLAAAISAGIYAAEIGITDLQELDREYQQLLGTSGQISVSDVPALRWTFETWKAQRLPLPDLDAVLASRASSCNQSAAPSAKRMVGSGVLRL